MDKPRAINKRTEPALVGMSLLALDFVLLIEIVINGSVFGWILVALLAVIAIVLIYFCNSKIILDEDGIHFISIAFSVRHPWSDLQRVGIEAQRLKYGSKNGVIVLWIKGRKKKIPYTRKNMKCIRAYYAEPDYDKWGKEPCQF